MLQPARGEILGGTANPALLIQGDEDNLVASWYAAVPRAVKGYEETMILLRKLGGVVKGQAERGRVGLHLH